MKLSYLLLVSLAFVGSYAMAEATCHVSGVLQDVLGPGGETTGLALFDKLNGKELTEVDDRTDSFKKFMIDPCSPTYQPVTVTGHYESRNMGPMVGVSKVLVAESIKEHGAPLPQDISSGIAEGFCPAATGHQAFVDLEAANQSGLMVSYTEPTCSVKFVPTEGSITVQVQSDGKLHSCTLNDNDPNVREFKDQYGGLRFNDGDAGTIASPNSCEIDKFSARGRTSISVTGPGSDQAYCGTN